jgi:hypothetical protein
VIASDTKSESLIMNDELTFPVKIMDRMEDTDMSDEGMSDAPLSFGDSIKDYVMVEDASRENIKSTAIASHEGILPQVDNNEDIETKIWELTAKHNDEKQNLRDNHRKRHQSMKSRFLKEWVNLCSTQEDELKVFLATRHDLLNTFEERESATLSCQQNSEDFMDTTRILQHSSDTETTSRKIFLPNHASECSSRSQMTSDDENIGEDHTMDETHERGTTAQKDFPDTFGNPEHDNTNYFDHRTLLDSAASRDFAKLLGLIERKFKRGNPSIYDLKGELSFIDLLKGLKKAFKDKSRYKPRSKFTGPRPKTAEAILQLLRSVVSKESDGREIGQVFESSEENIHSWEDPPRDTGSGMHFRIWDDKSASKVINPVKGFQSQSPHENLGTRLHRRKCILNHSKFESRTRSSFVSTTSSIADVNWRIGWMRGTPRWREPGSAVTKITVVNANARIDSKMPLLRMVDELKYYCGDNAYSNRSVFCNEYLWLFGIPADQIVRTYVWSDVRKWMAANKTGFKGWEKKVARSAFEGHESLRKKPGVTVKELHGGICICCGAANHITDA